MKQNSGFGDLTLVEHEGEPRVRGVVLGRRLGMKRPTNIRALIERHMATLEKFGPCIRLVHGHPTVADRQTVEYLLNEEQAVYIVTQSDAPNAMETKVAVVKVFVAWRHGRLAPVASPLTAKEHGGITKGIVNKALDERLAPLESAVLDLANRIGSVATEADARLMDALRRLFPPTKNAPALPPLGYQRFPDYLAEKGITCLTGGEKSGLSRKVVRFCRTRGFNVEEGFGGAYRSGVAFPTYALDCWWRDGGGEVSVISLVKAHQSRQAIKGAPLFPVISGGKDA